MNFNMSKVRCYKQAVCVRCVHSFSSFSFLITVLCCCSYFYPKGYFSLKQQLLCPAMSEMLYCCKVAETELRASMFLMYLRLYVLGSINLFYKTPVIVIIPLF